MIILNEQRGFTVFHMESEKMPNIELHLHTGYEIFWLLDGKAAYSVEGNIYNIESGDILITNMRELHAPLETGGGKYSRRILQVKPGFLSEFVTEQFNPFDCFENRPGGTGNLIPAREAQRLDLHSKILSMEKYFENPLPQSSAVIKALLLQVLVAIYENTQLPGKTYSENPKITQIIRYINQNITQDLSLDCISGIFYMNKYYLSHLFKAQTGFTICDYINRKRVLKSKSLLLNKTSPGDIPELVGFKDYSSFYRNFTRITGQSPRDFISPKANCRQ